MSDDDLVTAVAAAAEPIREFGKFAYSGGKKQPVAPFVCRTNGSDAKARGGATRFCVG